MVVLVYILIQHFPPIDTIMIWHIIFFVKGISTVGERNRREIISSYIESTLLSLQLKFELLLI